jgi:asparagine synthase (glutamine-hydrolysing)
MYDPPSRAATSRWNGFLAVSCGPAAPASLRRPVAAALDAMLATTVAATDRQPQHLAVRLSPVASGEGDGWVAAAGDAIDDSFDGDGEFTLGLGALVSDVGGELSVADVLDAVMTASPELAHVLPPFAIAHCASAVAKIRVAIDWLGLFQLYVWRHGDVAAVSTSARALSVLAGQEVDDAALGALAMIGWLPGDATLFAGVRAVPPATVLTLHRGTLSAQRFIEPLAFGTSSERSPALSEAVDEMAALLRVALDRYVGAHPDAVLQLTGGFDSRILLGAIASGRRGGVQALTLGDESSRDVTIASELCHRYAMVHQVHAVDGQEWPSPASVNHLVLSSAEALQCAASPLALAPLTLVERNIDQGHRLSGVAGEVGRGFYYAGQPRASSTSGRLIERLADWRLFSNEAVEPAALEPAFRAASRAATMQLLTTCFPVGDWLRATDEFYLYERVRRWGGAHCTVATMRRDSVNMLLNRRFVQLALAVAPTDKRDSQLAARLMSRLDPELASLPLDTGLVPARLGDRTLRTKAVGSLSSARRTGRKAWQRARRGRRPQVGAAHAATLLLEHWRGAPAVCAPLESVPGIDRSWLRGLLAGAHDAQPTTLAFLANVLAATTPADRTGQQESVR